MNRAPALGDATVDFRKPWQTDRREAKPSPRPSRHANGRGDAPIGEGLVGCMAPGAARCTLDFPDIDLGEFALLVAVLPRRRPRRRGEGPSQLRARQPAALTNRPAAYGAPMSERRARKQQ